MKFALVLLLACSSVAFAPPDEPKVPQLKLSEPVALSIVRTNPDGKHLIDLSVTGPDGAGLIWDVSGPTGLEMVENNGHLTLSGPDGDYTVRLRAILWDKKQILTATWTGALKRSEKPPEPPKPPVDPPKPSAVFYFLIVRPDGAAKPELSGSAWEALKAAGHTFKSKTLTEARGLGFDIPAGTLLPCVLTLKVNGTVSEQLPGIAGFPSTPDEIAKLAQR